MQVVRAGLAIVASGALGCSSLLDLGVGYQRSVNVRRSAVGIDASLGAGGREGGYGYQARAKLGSEIQQVGVGIHGYALEGGRFLGLQRGFQTAVFARGGVDLLQVGVAEGHGNVGLLCPFVDVGWLITNPGITLSASAQYDLRLSSARNDLWIGAFVGFGFAPAL